MFLLVRAPAARASSGPDSAGVSEGAGAPAAPGGAQPHPQDGAGVQQAGGAGAALTGGAGEESQTHQELGGCSCCGQMGWMINGWRKNNLKMFVKAPEYGQNKNIFLYVKI